MNISASRMANPYVGPVPFRAGQHLHGRDQDIEALEDLVLSKRIVLLVGPSGAGKTSLIQAALLPRLCRQQRSYRFVELPVVRFDTRLSAGLVDSDSNGSTNPYVLFTLQTLNSGPVPEPLPSEELARLGLPDYFRRQFPSNPEPGEEISTFPLLVIDQFEELFAPEHCDWEEKKAFLVQLGQVLGGADEESEGEELPEQDALPRVWAIISIQEDRVAELEPFLHLLPTGLDFRYRLLPLDADQAFKAVVQPARAVPADSAVETFFSDGAARALVNNLRALPSTGSKDPQRPPRLSRFVEPLLLQIICHRLWETVVEGEHRPIHETDIRRDDGSSGVDAALAAFLGEELARAATARGRQLALRDWLEKNLVSGKRRNRALETLGRPLGRELGELVERNVLRRYGAGDRVWLELSDDRMVEPLLANNREWRINNLAEFERQARQWADSGKPSRQLLSLKQLLEANKRKKTLAHALEPDAVDYLHKSANFFLTRTLIVATAAVVGAAAFFVYQNYRDAKQAEALIWSAQRDVQSGDFRAALDKIERGRLLHPKQYRKTMPQVDVRLAEALSEYPPVERHVGRHEGPITALGFADSGNSLLALTAGEEPRKWQVDDGRDDERRDEDRGWQGGGAGGVEHLPPEDGYVFAFHRSLPLFASVDSSNRLVVADALVAKPALGPPLGSAYGETRGVFNQDGTLLVTWSEKSREMRLWSKAGAWTDGARFGGTYGMGRICCAEFAGMQTLVSVDSYGYIAVWDIGQQPDRSSRPARRLHMESPGPGRGVAAMAVSAKGRWLAAGDEEGGVYVWDLDDAKQNQGLRLRPTQSHRDSVRGMAFSGSLDSGADSDTLVSVGEDEVLIEWNFPKSPRDAHELDAGTRVERIRGWNEELFSVVFHPAREGIVAIGGARTVRIVDLNTSNALAKPVWIAPRSGNTDEKWVALTGSRDMKVLAGLSADANAVGVWRGERDSGSSPYPSYRRSEAPRIPTEMLPLLSIALHPTGESLAVLSCKGDLAVFPLALRPNGDTSTTKGVSLDSSALASGVKKAWEMEFESAAMARDRQRRPGCASKGAVVFNPDGSVMVAALGPILRKWVRDGADAWVSRALPPEPENPLPQGEVIVALAFGPDGNDLVLAGSNRSLVVLKTSEHGTSGTGDIEKLVGSFKENVGHATFAVDKMAIANGESGAVLFLADDKGKLTACYHGSNSFCSRRLARAGSSANARGGFAVASDARVTTMGEDGLYLWDLRSDPIHRILRRLAPATRTPIRADLQND